MSHWQLPYKNSLISYYLFGTGPQKILCFHGFGEDALSFEFLSNYSGNQYTFYAIDLPFHGKTEWKDNLTFDTADLLKIVDEIFYQHETEIPPQNKTAPAKFKFSLLGFSLGGRVALSLFEASTSSIEKLILLAPDGLKVNFWYWLATQTWAGNKFFAFTMKNPGWFFSFLKGLNKLGLVNSSIFKFVNYYIGDAAIRNLLYTRWTTLRKLKPGIKSIKEKIREKKTPLVLMYGKHDRIILSSVGERFKKGIEEECKLTIIHSGHQVLHEKHATEIVQALLL